MSKPEKMTFATDVEKVLKLMINSIYTNRDIFMRELVSNASDACDKLRYLALTDQSLLAEDPEFKIKVSIDKDQKKIIISDNGIGMDKDELISNLGTIARSGTEKFFESIGPDAKKNSELIGQFGVGFYSAFIVSNNVKVFSKKAGQNDCYCWSSSGESDFEIIKSDELKNRGTRIELSIRDEDSMYLEKYKIENIIKTYSDHIAFPIELEDKSSSSFEIINSRSAIWTREKSDIKQKEYEDFYSYISHMPGTPWMTIHNKLEGGLSYTNLLYIPKEKPFDLFSPERKSTVKLYIQKVFITDDTNNLIPPFLRFLKGVVDSNDLGLNISREVLQNSPIIGKIKTSITKKVLSSLKTKAEKEPQEYEIFWKNFGEILKEGLCEFMLSEKEQILEICKFNTISQNSLISLDEYINNMKEGQNDIYYLLGDNVEIMKKNPQLEGFKQKGLDVLLLSDHVDTFWLNIVTNYKNKNLKSITSSGLDLSEIKNLNQKEEKEEIVEDNQPLIDYVKLVLQDKVSDVKVSSKLVNSPACITIPEGNFNIRMEKFLIAQKQLNKKSQKIFEINPKHNILRKIKEAIAEGKQNEKTKDLIMILFDQACLTDGEDIEDPVMFATRLNSFFDDFRL